MIIYILTLSRCIATQQYSSELGIALAALHLLIKVFASFLMLEIG